MQVRLQKGGAEMPKAVVTQDTERFDLKTLEGGYVELRRLTYGEMLRSRDQAQSLRPQQENGQTEMEGVFHVSKVTMFRFSRAIADHNLEDEDGRKLNLGDAKDLAKLDPRIGGEIEDFIIAMNEPPDEKEDSFRGSGDSSPGPREVDSKGGS